MNLEIIALSKSQTKTDIVLISGIYTNIYIYIYTKTDTYKRNLKKMAQMKLFTKQKQTHRHKKQIYSSKGKGGGIN